MYGQCLLHGGICSPTSICIVLAGDVAPPDGINQTPSEQSEQNPDKLVAVVDTVDLEGGLVTVKIDRTSIATLLVRALVAALGVLGEADILAAASTGLAHRVGRALGGVFKDEGLSLTLVVGEAAVGADVGLVGGGLDEERVAEAVAIRVG